jgi:hypothetical protein
MQVPTGNVVGAAEVNNIFSKRWWRVVTTDITVHGERRDEVDMEAVLVPDVPCLPTQGAR